MTRTSQLPEPKNPDSRGMPGRPHPTRRLLPCPWSWPDTYRTPHDHVFTAFSLAHPTPTPLEPLSKTLSVQLAGQRGPLLSLWACHLPWLLAPKMNFSLSLFQTLLSWILGFSGVEFLQACSATVLANSARRYAFDLPNALGIARDRAGGSSVPGLSESFSELAAGTDASVTTWSGWSRVHPTPLYSNLTRGEGLRS